MEALRLDEMSDEQVLNDVQVLVKRSNETTAELLRYLAEVDRRVLHLRKACGSLFAYCVERLHMSEAAAGKRITAARTARRFPLVLAMIARGDIHLSGVTLLAPHLTEENHADVLARARHRSKRAIERLVAKIAPRPDVPSRVVALPARKAVAAALSTANATGPRASAATAAGAAAEVPSATVVAVGEPEAVERAPGRASSGPGPRALVAPLAPRRYQIRVTVDEDTHAALCQLQDLLAHQIPDRDPAAIISRALAHELERTLARKTGASERPRAPKPPAGRSRHIPAAVRREVWARDGGQCAFVDENGGRCSSTRFLEYHHVRNWARGAGHEPAEVALRCRAHNQYQAVLDYGADFMAARTRRNPSRAEEPRAAYALRARAADTRRVGARSASARGPGQGGDQLAMARRIGRRRPAVGWFGATLCGLPGGSRSDCRGCGSRNTATPARRPHPCHAA